MMKISTISRWVASSLAALLSLTACSTMPGQSPVKTAQKDGPPPFPVDVSQLKDAVPKNEPKCAYGNPSSYTAEGKRYYVLNSSNGYSKIGVASWYGSKFHGKLTSSHEPYDMLAMTAASPDLPIPTYVRVTNLENGRQVVVKVNDRGPFANDRIMDLSYAAAKKLGYAEQGTAKVKVEAISIGHRSPVVVAQNDLSSHSKQLYLQVGAFRQMARAEQVKIKVAQLTHQAARIAPLITSDAKTLYRVQIGPLRDLEKSDLLNQLERQGFNDMITVLG